MKRESNRFEDTCLNDLSICTNNFFKFSKFQYDDIQF